MGTSRQELAVVILAAGKGTRMKSRRAKVLHEAAGRPLLGYALETAERLGADPRIVVVGHGAEQVEAAFRGRARFVLQEDQRGTGHAVQQTAEELAGFPGDVLILYADTPLLRTETLEAMIEKKRATGAELVLLTSPEPLPGRVVRGADGLVARIVESTDATPEELEIQEGNTGVYLLAAPLLWKLLAQVDDRNQQGEIYLTTIIEGAVAEGRKLEALCLDDADECLGVNTRSELAQAAAVLRDRKAQACMAGGVTLEDPASTYLDTDVTIGRDSIIEPGCVIRKGTRIGQGVHVKAHTTIEDSQIDDDVVIGPCAHLRPGSHLHTGVRIGNFVEVKNSELGPGVKADHLAYIGDTDADAGASFGCGAITVNYDWKSKSRTTVGAGARIGCNANLVAPISVGKNAAVAAGSTVTRDVPAGALGVARERQRNIEGWRERREARAEASEKPEEETGRSSSKGTRAPKRH